MGLSKTKIIGGMFGLPYLPKTQYVNPPFLCSKTKLLINARSSMYAVAKYFSPSNIWLPSYLCDAMLQAVDSLRVKFYGVDENLLITNQSWIADVQSGDLVVFIDYFGFPTDGSLISKVQRKKALTLRDAAQALLTEPIGEPADFTIYSPRKFLGVPDGGILSVGNHIQIDDIPLEETPSEWWLKAYQATLFRRDFDLCGGDRSWFSLFQETEREAPIGAYAMSELTRKLLAYGFDYDEVKRKRVENYLALAEKLEQFALFPDLPSRVIPIGFPIRLENRDQIRSVLFEQHIYPPIHWEIANVVPPEFVDSHLLSKQIMTLPCDQRYDLSDMDRMAEIILRHV